MAEPTAGNQVFELAIRLEEVARDFYEALGQGSDNPQVREFCSAAAREEAAHRTIFEKMRLEWTRSEQSRLMPPEALEALQTMVKDRTYPGPAEVQRVGMGGDLAGALKLAMDIERGSIRLYEDMRGNLPALAETLERILEQERTHLSRLQALAGNVGKGR